MTKHLLALVLVAAACGLVTGAVASPEIGSETAASGDPAVRNKPVPSLEAAPAFRSGPTRVEAPQEAGAPDYNGQFTYVRIRFGDAGTDLRSMGWGRRSRGAPWRHDYPDAEINFAKILNATTFIDTYMEGRSGRVLTLNDPELFRYPIATIIEVGYWRPSDEEVARLREYLLKGGFLIVDDTRGDWALDNLAYQMWRVLPEYQIQMVPEDHEVFNSFFKIEEPYSLVPPYGYEVPRYLGIFQDNDPQAGRIMVMINWNQDLQEYWEYSDRGYYPIDLSNEAYKFGVNYLIYAFTH